MEKVDAEKEFKAGFKAYHQGGRYPRDWSQDTPFRQGWQAASDADAEDLCDSADELWCELNPFSPGGDSDGAY